MRLLHWLFRHTLPEPLWLRWCSWRLRHDGDDSMTMSEYAHEVLRQQEIDRLNTELAEAKHQQWHDQPATARRRETAEAVFGVQYDDLMEQHLIHGTLTANEYRALVRDEFKIQ